MIVGITKDQHKRALSLCDQFDEGDARFDGNNETVQFVISKAVTKLLKCYSRGTFPRLRKNIKRKQGEKHKEMFLTLNKSQKIFILALSQDINISQSKTVRIVLEWYLYDQLVISQKKWKSSYGVKRNSPNWDNSFN